MNSQSARKTCVCECTNSTRVTAEIVGLEFLWPGPPPKAGQFFLIKPLQTGVFLARPISIAGLKRGGTLRFLVAIRGKGSREIAEMRPGEEAEITGPLGNFWPLELISRGPVALVAGGIGIAPLLALAAELEKKPDNFVFDFYAGFRSGSFGQKMKARILVITTEDGSLGKKGRITDFFKPSGYRLVFACGPEPMLKTVASICEAARVPCLISMEKHMACGVGACLGCTVKTTVGNRRCCADGPIFNALDIQFED